MGVIAITDWDFRKRLESLKFDNPDYDLLVLGTSLVLYGIDTEYLTSKGIKSFNLALAGSSLKTNYIQLSEYITKYSHKPEFVLLGFNTCLEIFETKKIHPVVEFTTKHQKFKLKDAPISKFRWSGVELLKKILSSNYRKTKVIYGQVRFQVVNPDNTSYKEISLDLQNYESAFYIGEIAKLCEANGIKPILIEIPGFRETQNISEIGPYYLSYSMSDSLPLYNFNNQYFCRIFDSKVDWCGRSHLNASGSRKFTEELYNRILLNEVNSFRQ